MNILVFDTIFPVGQTDDEVGLFRKFATESSHPNLLAVGLGFPRSKYNAGKNIHFYKVNKDADYYSKIGFKIETNESEEE